MKNHLRGQDLERTFLRKKADIPQANQINKYYFFSRKPKENVKNP